MKTNILVAPELIVVDVEGNGQSPPDLVEIAIMRMNFPMPPVNEVKAWKIRPPRPVIPRVARLHGLTNKLLASEPLWEDVMEEVHSALGDRWLIGHNAKTELDVIGRHLPSWNPAGVLDTLKMSRAIWPNLTSHSLDSLIAHCDLPVNLLPQERHRAAFDVYATGMIFLRLFESMPDPTWESICAVGRIDKPGNEQQNYGVQETLW